MNEINTLISAYNWGNLFLTTPVGSELNKRYYNIKENLSQGTWDFFQRVIYDNLNQHYFSFKIAYEKISYLGVEKEGIFKEYFHELESCVELRLLIDEAENVGVEIQDLFNKMANNMPEKSSSEIISTFELYRESLDYFYQFQSTKFFVFFAEHKHLLNNPKYNISKFIQSKESLQFTSNNRHIIRDLAINELNRDIMYALEYLDVLRSFTLQIIFETNFNNIYLSEKNQLFDYREKIINKFRLFSLEEVSIIDYKRSSNFILFFEDGIISDIGLIKRKKLINKGPELGVKMIINGWLYPNEDYNILLA